MVDVPNQLKQAMEEFRDGGHPKATVRELLDWFGAARRRSGVVARIRAALDEVDLLTYPDFEGEWIDAEVYFMDKNSFTRANVEDGDASGAATTTTVQDDSIVEPVTGREGSPISEFTPVDPSHRLARLEAAHSAPVSVSPNDPLERMTGLMLRHDYSQLPVMTSDREVKGIVSWKSIGSRLALGQRCQTANDCMEPHKELPSDASIFDAIDVIAQHDCVLVRSRDKRITGIVTAADINEQYHQLAEPFLLLSDIETQTRNLIASAFSVEELRAAKDPADADREVDGVADLTFGEYIRLLENEQRWNKLGLNLDRKTFVADLDDVREIRNDVMHFDPDGISEEALETLRSFAKFLERLGRLRRVDNGA